MIYNYGFLDENTKKEIRRKILKAISIPGYQVPFGSRELPIAKGWGTGGLQLTLSLIGKNDVVKVIDQGSDDSTNACNIRSFIASVSNVETTKDTLEATLIQTRHRIPEEKLKSNQILIFQVPIPETLRIVEPSEVETRRMHSEEDYSRMWVYLYEDIVRFNDISIAVEYPCKVNDRYLMNPSPIPRFDIKKLNMSDNLFLFGAGREKRIYAIPPYTKVEPLEFEDYKFEEEKFEGKYCSLCNSTNTFLDEVYDSDTNEKYYSCSDTSYCEKVRLKNNSIDVTIGGTLNE